MKCIVETCMFCAGSTLMTICFSCARVDLTLKGEKTRRTVQQGYWIRIIQYLISYCVKASLTQVIESPVHDAGFGGIDGLDLISAQRPSREPVVIMLPAVETTETHFSPTP